MKKTQKYTLFALWILITCIVQTSIIICPPSTSKTNQTTTTSGGALFTPTMSTTSINEKAIDTIYGKNGLNFSQKDVTQIKQTYSYLEVIVKSHKIATDPALKKDRSFFSKMAVSKKTNDTDQSQEMLNSQEWKSIIITNAEIETSDVWQLYLKSAIVDYYENQQDFIKTISMVQDQIFPYLPNIELNFYNNDFIQLRAFAELLRAKKILQDSTLQQNLQACIDWKGKDQATIDANVAAFKLTDFYTYTHDKTKWTAAEKTVGHPTEEYIMTYFMLTTILSIVQDKLDQKNLLSFLTRACSPTLSPNFFWYQTSDFVCLDDILTLQAQLNKKANTTPAPIGANPESFNISDLVDMSKAGIQKEPAGATKNSSSGQKEADNVVIQKSKNPFKSISHSISKAADDVGKGISKAADVTGAGITTAATDTGDSIAKSATDFANSAVSTAKETGSGLEDTAKATEKDLDVKGVTNAITTAVPLAAESIAKGAQGVGEGIAGSSAIVVGATTGDKKIEGWGKQENKSAAAQIKTSGKDFNKAISTLSKIPLFGTITHGVEGIALGAAGFGATMIGDIVYAATGNKTVKNWGDSESKKAMRDLQDTGKDIDAVINGTAKALEDGIVAPIALIAGNAIGFITQDKQIGQSMTVVMNQVCDSAIALGATCLTSMNNLVNQQLVAIYKVSESGAEMIVDAVMTIYGGVTGQTAVTDRSAAMTTAASKGLVKNMVKGVTGTFSCVVTSTMDMVMDVAAVMAAVENSMTTITFDLVDEITFLGCGIGELMGAPVNAAQERDKVDAKMEAQRSTINVVMSVVLMVALTVATLGAAAPEAGAVISAEVGSEAATEIATETATEVATNTTEQTAEQVAAEQATKLAVATAATEEVATEGITEAATEATTETAATSTGVTDGVSTTVTEGTEVATEGVGEATVEQGAKNASYLALYGGEILGQAINLVFSVFSVMSAENQDDTAIKMLAQEKASIMNLWQFIESNKVVMTQSQNLYIDELHKKHQVAIENQTFGLNYYTNYLNSSVNNVQSQISHALSEQYIDMLTPDANGSRTADIGSTWGLTTPFVYLYPSQGFITTTLGRSDFPYAQEIAQAPLIAQDKGADNAKNNLDSSKKEPSKLWFNQRAVANINQAADAPLTVEIKFKIIYNLTSDFYVGLYLGGKYYDYNSPEYLADIQNTGNIHLDDAHLAKMFVLKREGEEKTPSLGVYENEGKEWLVNKPLDATLFNNASTYYMSATLHKDHLTVTFWPQDKPLAKWSSTVTVTPSDQKTFGVIFSGAAIEWNVIKPSMPIHQNNKVRTGVNNPPEADRERAAKKLWTTLKTPIFGTINLETVGKQYLIEGQYLYTTQDTKLTTQDGKIISDTVVFAMHNSGALSNIGMSPVTTDASSSSAKAPADAKQPNVIVSMINGNIYDNKGTILDTKQNPWPLFMKNNGPFSKTFINSITTAQKSVPQKAVTVTPKPSAAKTTAPVTPSASSSSTTPSNYGTVSLSDMAVSATPSTGGFQFGLSNQVPATKVPAQSLDKRQSQAASGATVQVGGLAGANTTPVTMSSASVGAAGFSL